MNPSSRNTIDDQVRIYPSRKVASAHHLVFHRLQFPVAIAAALFLIEVTTSYSF
jgi:hypothetical protein